YATFEWIGAAFEWLGATFEWLGAAVGLLGAALGLLTLGLARLDGAAGERALEVGELFGLPAEHAGGDAADAGGRLLQGRDEGLLVPGFAAAGGDGDVLRGVVVGQLGAIVGQDIDVLLGDAGVDGILAQLGIPV